MSVHTNRLMLTVLLAVVFVSTARLTADEPQSAHKIDGDAIGKAAGTKPTTTPDGTVRLAWARADVKVTVDGMPLKPFAGLGSWAAFRPAPHGAMVMGDTVV